MVSGPSLGIVHEEGNPGIPETMVDLVAINTRLLQEICLFVISGKPHVFVCKKRGTDKY